jgi:hypothetical protein
MNSVDSFKKLPLDILMDLFSEATQKLLESKINNQIPAEIANRQRTVELIQLAIVSKRTDNQLTK